MVLTEIGDKYTLHVQRDNGMKLAVSMIQRALNDKYGSPEKYTHRTGVVVKGSGNIRGHGGARSGVTWTTGGGDGDKKDGRYIRLSNQKPPAGENHSQHGRSCPLARVAGSIESCSKTEYWPKKSCYFQHICIHMTVH